MPDQDLQQTPPADGGSAEQPIDWEARYKGLNRTYTTLKTQHDANVEALTAARATAATVQQRVDELEGARSSDATRYEGQIAQLTAQVGTLTSENGTLQQQIDTLNGQVTTAQKDAAVRRTLSQQKYQGLMPLYDEGLLDGLRDLEGDALVQKLNSAVQMMGQQTTSALQHLFAGGALPPAPGAGAAPTDGAKLDELQSWLMNPTNITDPTYANVEERYFTLLSKQK